jgi:hypothetical protein
MDGILHNSIESPKSQVPSLKSQVSSLKSDTT